MNVMLTRQPNTKIAESRFWVKAAIGDGCWNWTAYKDDLGRGSFSVGNGKNMRAHRVAYMLAQGSADLGGLQVNHHCDNPSCIRPSHLYLGTQRDNIEDAVKRGRIARGNTLGDRRGINNVNAKLTPDSVRDMRAAYACGGVTQVELSERFGISQQVVSKVINRRLWGHVE